MSGVLFVSALWRNTLRYTTDFKEMIAQTSASNSGPLLSFLVVAIAGRCRRAFQPLAPMCSAPATVIGGLTSTLILHLHYSAPLLLGGKKET